MHHSHLKDIIINVEMFFRPEHKPLTHLLEAHLFLNAWSSSVEDLRKRTEPSPGTVFKGDGVNSLERVVMLSGKAQDFKERRKFK